MAEVLIVHYSYTGTSRRVASILSGLRNWSSAEVVDARPERTRWRCVLDSLLHRKPPIHYKGPPPREFDAVVLVAPIWVGRLAGPMRSFVAQYRDQLQKVSVVCTQGAPGASNAEAEIGRLLGRQPILGIAMLQREVEDVDCTGPLRAFGEAVESALAGRDEPAARHWAPQGV